VVEIDVSEVFTASVIRAASQKTVIQILFGLKNIKLLLGMKELGIIMHNYKILTAVG
jgi:hypothetical protein